MSDSREPVWHRSGDITFPWRGDEFSIYLPTIGESRVIEAYGVELSEAFGLDEKQERLRQVTVDLAEAEASGDADLIAEVNARITEENEQVANELVAQTREQSVKWFQKVIELCGSDNWPADPDDWPAPCRSNNLVTLVKAHWARAPLAWGALQNGAQHQTNPTIINN